MPKEHVLDKKLMGAKLALSYRENAYLKARLDEQEALTKQALAVLKETRKALKILLPGHEKND